VSAEPSDHYLLQRFRQGSQDAAVQLYGRYVSRLRALARSRLPLDLARCVDVDDIVQSVFGSFFRGARQGCYAVPAGAELWHLLAVIALNKIRAKGVFHRAARRDVRRTAGSDELDCAPAARAAADETAHVLLQLAIADALQGLPAVYGTMLRLRIEGHEVAEIARQTGRSKRAVERILQELRRHLAQVLESSSVAFALGAQAFRGVYATCCSSWGNTLCLA
jgi:RNA polymerase sigma-70 factor (ECF subfamily)